MPDLVLEKSCSARILTTDKVEEKESGGLIGGFYWTALNMGFTQGSTFLAAILVARLLGKEDFGKFAILYSTLLTVSSIAQLSIGTTATKFMAESLPHNKGRAGRILGFSASFALVSGCIASTALAALGPFVADRMLYAPEMGKLFFISSGFVLFSVLGAYQAGAVMGLHGQKALGIFAIPAGLFHVGALVLGAMAWGLVGVAIGLLGSAVFRWILQAKVLRSESTKRGIGHDIRHAWDERAVLTRFALPAALAGLSTLPALWIGQVLLAKHATGFEAVGIYAAGNNLRTMILFLPLALNSVGTAFLNTHWGARDAVRYRETFWKNLGLTAALLIVGVGIIVMFAPQALSVFGQDFSSRSAEVVVALMALAALPEGLAVSIYQIIQSRAKMWTSLWLVAMPRDITFVALAFVLTPLHGAVGLACAYLSAQLLSLLAVTGITWFIGVKVTKALHGF